MSGTIFIFMGVLVFVIFSIVCATIELICFKQKKNINNEIKSIG